MRDSAQRRTLDTVRVVGRVDDLIGSAASASEGRIGAADLRRRPITREGELLETVPGVIVTQHSGEGKANQYFVRGFNLDHGTDFQTMLEGMPLNMPSHGHGQGYTDLNFLIPELVDQLDYRLGVHHAEIGDFGSAGGAEIRLLRTLERPFAAISGGRNGYARAVGANGARLHGGDLLVAGEAKAYDGPWVRPGADAKAECDGAMVGRARRIQLVAPRRSRTTTGGTPTIRSRCAPCRPAPSPRFGQIDSSDGGRTQRFSVSGTWMRVGARSVQDVELFAIRSDLGLFSNFTYFLADPVRGDQFARRPAYEPRRERAASDGHVGARRRAAAHVRHAGQIRLRERSRPLSHRAAGAARTIREDRVRVSTVGLFVEAESRWSPHFRSVLGLRGDGFAFDVASDRAANSGRRRAAAASPRRRSCSRRASRSSCI